MDVQEYLMEIGTVRTPFMLSYLHKHIPQLNKQTRLVLLDRYVDRINVPYLDNRPAYHDELRYVPLLSFKSRLWRIWLALFSQHFAGTPLNKGYRISVRRVQIDDASMMRSKTLVMQRYTLADFGETIARVICAYDAETDTLFVVRDS